MTKLLIVDDSALMRKCLREIFEVGGKFEIVTAKNGREALAQIELHNPDVVTLDINMPEMDGLTCLSEIMTKSPRPVVMVSSITSKGAQATLEALELGAVDFVEKPGGTVSLNIETVRKELIVKVEAAARSKPRRTRGLVQRVRQAADSRPKPRPSAPADGVGGVVVIGVSTGGPRTLEDILPELPADFPWPVVVAQHMPGAFTNSFAARLDKICALHVVEVTSALPLKRRRHRRYAARPRDRKFGRRGQPISLASQRRAPGQIGDAHDRSQIHRRRGADRHGQRRRGGDDRPEKGGRPHHRGA
jgi:two-component system chemotaxis response regulator CheB